MAERVLLNLHWPTYSKVWSAFTDLPFWRQSKLTHHAWYVRSIGATASRRCREDTAPRLHRGRSTILHSLPAAVNKPDVSYVTRAPSGSSVNRCRRFATDCPPNPALELSLSCHRYRLRRR